MKNRAFTLIELLVVVLIIGILAAIAVPKYQFAVAKSQAVQLQVRVNAIYKAAKIYELTNGTWPNDIRDLDIDITEEAMEFKADTWVTGTEHIAAYYDKKSSCGVANGYSFCKNKDLFIRSIESSNMFRCEGITDIGIKLCETIL